MLKDASLQSFDSFVSQIVRNCQPNQGYMHDKLDDTDYILVGLLNIAKEINNLTKAIEKIGKQKPNVDVDSLAVKLNRAMMLEHD